MQNDAVHCITVTKRCEHNIPVLASLHWLPDHSKIDLKMLNIFKALNDPISKCISELLDCYVPSQSLSSVDGAPFFCLSHFIKICYISNTIYYFNIYVESLNSIESNCD